MISNDGLWLDPKGDKVIDHDAISMEMWRSKGFRGWREGKIVVDWCVEAISLLGLIIVYLFTINALEILLYQTSEKWIRVFKIYLSIRDTFRVQS